MDRTGRRTILALTVLALVVGLSSLAFHLLGDEHERPSSEHRPAAHAPTPVPPPTEDRIPTGLAVPIPFEDPTGRALERFHAALERAERDEGSAHVLVWGASHTACDHFPAVIRHGLAERFGDAGRGFTLAAWPSTLWPYWQDGVDIAAGETWERIRLGTERGDPDHYGIAGIVFDSRGRAAVARIASKEGEEGARASRIEVLTEAQPEGGVLDVSIDGAPVDSIDTASEDVAAQYTAFDVEDAPHTIELRAREGAPVRLYGVRWLRAGPGVSVENVALTGARARNHLKWLEPVYDDHIAHVHPDLVVLFYGGNEGNDFDRPINDYAATVERAYRKILRAAPDASCLVLGPADKPLIRDDGFAHRARTTSIARVQRDIALRLGCAHFDTIQFMGGRMSMVEWVESSPALGRSDYIHFTQLGYRRLGEVLLDGLLAGYGSERARGVEVTVTRPNEATAAPR